MLFSLIASHQLPHQNSPMLLKSVPVFLLETIQESGAIVRPTLLFQVVAIGDSEWTQHILQSLVTLPASTKVVVDLLEGASQSASCSTHLWTYYPCIYLILFWAWWCYLLFYCVRAFTKRILFSADDCCASIIWDRFQCLSLDGPGPYLVMQVSAEVLNQTALLACAGYEIVALFAQEFLLQRAKLSCACFPCSRAMGKTSWCGYR